MTRARHCISDSRSATSRNALVSCSSSSVRWPARLRAVRWSCRFRSASLKSCEGTIGRLQASAASARGGQHLQRAKRPRGRRRRCLEGHPCVQRVGRRRRPCPSLGMPEKVPRPKRERGWWLARRPMEGGFCPLKQADAASRRSRRATPGAFQALPSTTTLEVPGRNCL